MDIHGISTPPLVRGDKVVTKMQELSAATLDVDKFGPEANSDDVEKSLQHLQRVLQSCRSYVATGKTELVAASFKRFQEIRATANDIAITNVTAHQKVRLDELQRLMKNMDAEIIEHDASVAYFKDIDGCTDREEVMALHTKTLATVCLQTWSTKISVVDKASHVRFLRVSLPNAQSSDGHNAVESTWASNEQCRQRRKIAGLLKLQTATNDMSMDIPSRFH